VYTGSTLGCFKQDLAAGEKTSSDACLGHWMIRVDEGLGKDAYCDD